MKRELLIARGLVATGLWILGAGTAEATTYDYGVGLYQQEFVSGASYKSVKNFSFGNYYSQTPCFTIYGPEGGCGDLNGSTSVSNSKTLSTSGSIGQNPILTGTGEASDKSTTSMGAIHLEMSLSGNGPSTLYNPNSSGINEASWVDTLTIGNNFPPTTPLKFLATLSVSGSVQATSQELPTGGGSGSEVIATSLFQIYNGGFSSPTNIQKICQTSYAGKSTECGPGTQNSPYEYSTVLTTYPGEMLIVYGGLELGGSVTGEVVTYPCSTCVHYAGGTAEAYFLDTSLFTFIPITPGAFYTSASGTLYSGPSGPISATPEPPSGLLFLSGFLGLLALGRRGSSSGRRRVGKVVP